MSIKYENHEEFFKNLGDRWVGHVTVEEMYQHFKSRLVTEVAVNSDELMNYAELKVLK